MRLTSRDEQVSMRLVSRWFANLFLEAGEERNRVERHLDIHVRSKLGPDAAHALAGRAQALPGLALDYQDVGAAGARQVIGNARAYDACTDDDYVRVGHKTDESMLAMVGRPHSAI